MISLLLIVYFILIGCGDSYSKQNIIDIDENVFLVRSTFDDFRDWELEDYGDALLVFLQSCEKILELPSGTNIFPQINRKVNKTDFYAVCKIGNVIRNYNKKYLQVFFENYFVPYKVVSKNNKSLFTGYYLPQINAKRKKDKVYKYPIYGRHSDFENNGKYYTREEINNGALNNKNLEILYTDDPVELFFLHIQGSGSVYLVDENKTISIGFDGKNNYKFTSIGNYMYRNGLISKDKLNAKDLKADLKKDINLAKKVMNQNKSYIFFRIIENNAVVGAFGTTLVPYRTIAVDKKYIPLGFPLWLETTHNTKRRNTDFNKIVIANDTGSAINGAVRGDIFFGSGVDGENDASFQYSSGTYYLLIPTKIVKKL
ncbi:MAG: MltA domain-containing protein [Rickettsiales bacterium]|nr:MltA domain-containing protein [Rickettsiales bacterium]